MDLCFLFIFIGKFLVFCEWASDLGNFLFFCEWVSDMAPPKPQPKWYSLSSVMFKFELENGSDLCFWHLGFEKIVSF